MSALLPGQKYYFQVQATNAELAILRVSRTESILTGSVDLQPYMEVQQINEQPMKGL